MKLPPRAIKKYCTFCCGAGHTIVPNGEYLRALRERYGISQREMARRIGCSPMYLSDIERGRRNCPSSMAAAYRAWGRQ